MYCESFALSFIPQLLDFCLIVNNLHLVMLCVLLNLWLEMSIPSMNQHLITIKGLFAVDSTHSGVEVLTVRTYKNIAIV